MLEGLIMQHTPRYLKRYATNLKHPEKNLFRIQNHWEIKEKDGQAKQR